MVCVCTDCCHTHRPEPFLARSSEVSNAHHCSVLCESCLWSGAAVCPALVVGGQRQSFQSDSVAKEGRTGPSLAKPFQSMAIMSRGIIS